MMNAPRFATAFAFATLLALGCGDDPLTPGTTDTSVVLDTEIVIDLDAVVVVDTTPVDPFDTLAPSGDASADTAVVEPSCDDDPKPFFCPCQNNVQCDSGFCVAVGEAEVSARCSRTCSDTCPSGWECRGISGGGDPVFICQPPIDNLCEPCTVDANCGAVGDRCVAFEDGDYCGQDCQGAPDSCPPLYTCGEVTNEAGQILAYQCLPESGSCNCPAGTDYVNDPDHCGGCNKACHFNGGVAACEQSTCVLDDCLDGFVDLDEEDFNGCEYACTVVPGAEDWPDAVCNGSSCDQDCDGLDGSWARGVFVSATGNASGAGTPEDPTNTIGKGIDIAHTTPGKDHVYIAAGTYNEQVTVREGVSLFGGYSNDGQWRRSLAQFQTVVTSSSGATSIRAMVVDGVQTTRTVIDGLTVNSGTNANPGGSSYAIWIRNSSSVLELIRVTAVGGSGGAGASGSNGSPGNPGGDASPGTSATDYDCMINGCDWSSFAGKGGAGGTNACSSGTNSGGGGGASVPSCASGGNTGSSAPSGTPGGAPETGGTNGDPGSHGSHGAGGLAGGTVSAAGFWSGHNGADGSNGTNGKGGGGGGSGKNDKGNHIACSFTDTYRYGGGGGGGGGGGCGGTRGTAGRAGGGSFGVFLHDASPKLIDSALGHKSGGNGGNGGVGGGGGGGKAGKSGGGGICQGGGCGTSGGKGGNGGNGGNGGHGGGGAGGVAYGLYINGTSSPSCAGLSFSPPGAGGGGGVGGTGGTSAGNKGANGAFGDKNKSTASCP